MNARAVEYFMFVGCQEEVRMSSFGDGREDDLMVISFLSPSTSVIWLDLIHSRYPLDNSTEKM